MVKFKITPARFAEACSISEYLAATSGGQRTMIRIAPRFVLGEDGEYIVKVNEDSDGDVTLENVDAAMLKILDITPKRLERLQNELMEAAKAIVNPPSGGA